MRMTTEMDSATPNSQPAKTMTATTLVMMPAMPTIAKSATTRLQVDSASTRKARAPLITMPRTALLTNAFSLADQAMPSPPCARPRPRPPLSPAFAFRPAT